MSPLLEIKLNQIGQQLVDRLVKDIKEKPVTKYGAVNASGDLAKSIHYEVYENGVKIKGNDYIYYLEHGRGVTTKGSKPGKLKGIIRQWIDDKGIVPDGISKDSLAFLITRKIHKSGTTIFEQGGSDLVSGLLDSDFFANITKELEDEIVFEIRADLFKALAA